jgi:hypothetical protein
MVIRITGLNRLTLGLASIILVSGCAGKSFVAPAADSATFIERGETQTQGTIRVTAAVPGAEETESIIGLDLYSQGVQPVWLTVTNTGEKPARAALVSVDDEYYSPLEVAWINRDPYSKEGRVDMERWFYEHQMPRRIPPGETRSGFVLTHLTGGTKGFNFDVYTADGSANFTFFIPVPGFKADYMEVDFKSLYTLDEIQALDEDGLKQALADLSCCSTDETGNAEGDPFNVAMVGSALALRRALLRGGWQETAANSPDTALARTHRYKGRKPDGTFHKSRPDGSARKELRLWLSPMLVDDQRLWFCQVSYDMGGKAGTTSFEDYRIDPDIDDARMFIMQNFWYNQSLAKFGFVAGGPLSDINTPKRNFHGSEYFTDGMRVIMFVSEGPIALDDTVLLNWSRLQ